MAKPNILFILADDQGCWALGAAGNPEIRTPQLDCMAANGMRFTNFFCTSPVCSPARASILTGRIPSQHGVLDWIAGGNIGDEAVDYLQGQTIWPSLLAERGYLCGLIGKWHLGDSAAPRKGFSRWLTTPYGGGCYMNPDVIRDGKVVRQQGYLTDILADEAMQFLGDAQKAGQPFYLSLHFTAPHSPWIDQHPREIVDSYNGCQFLSAPQEPKHEWLDVIHDFDFSRMHANPGRGDIPVREYLKGYFASITAMDAAIGRVLNRLDELGMRDDTLVIFMSDNGFNCGQHGIWGKGCGTYPLNLYDTSVKIPCLMAWPDRIAPGAVSDTLLSQYDIMPTMLDILGFAGGENENLPGRSFAGVLDGHNTNEDCNDRIYVFDEYGSARMIRTKEWKYIHRYPDGPNEFYDLRGDPDERKNLCGAEKSPDMRRIRGQLHADMEAWFARYVRPEFDGKKFDVMGRGQLRPIATQNSGRQLFRPRSGHEYEE